MNNSIIYDGNFTQATPIKAPRVKYPIPNFLELVIYNQDYVQLSATHRPPTLGAQHPIYANAILVEETGHTNLPGGLISFTRTFCTVPSSSFRTPVLLSYSFPGYKNYTPKWTNTHTTNNIRTYQVTEWKERIWREPKPKEVIGNQTTTWHNLLAPEYSETNEITLPEFSTNTPILYKGQIYYPTVIHPNGDFIINNAAKTQFSFGLQSLRTDGTGWQAVSKVADGYSFDGLDVKQAFQITDARKTTQEQLYNFNGEERVFYQTIYGTVEQTNYTSPTSSPTSIEYTAMRNNGQEINAQATQIEQFIGCIYVTKDVTVKAE